MTKTKRQKSGAPDTSANESAASAATVTVVRTKRCEKLNPARGGGSITYQVGRDQVGRDQGGQAFLRLLSNEGGGRFSREWVSFEKLRTCFPPAVLKGAPFKANALGAAFKGRSTTNGGFLTAVARAEGLAREDAEHRGMSLLLCDDFDAWVQGVLDADPEQNEDGSVKLEPLHPPAKGSPFKPKSKGDGAKRTDGVETPEDASVPPAD